MGWEGRKGGKGGSEGEGEGGEGKGDMMWRGPESGLPRGPCWLSAGLGEGGRGRKEGGKREGN